jgi:putative redox protein
MIESLSAPGAYRTQFTDGRHTNFCDVPAENGGQDAEFCPMDLLPAALACCVNMTVRMYADKHGIPLGEVRTKVELDRSVAEQPVFRYAIELEGNFTAEQRDKLLLAAKACPVRRILSKPVLFEELPPEPNLAL